MKSFVSALEILLERYQFELGYISREIEQNEKERAFLLRKRRQFEEIVRKVRWEIHTCPKGSEQQSKQ